MKSLSGASFWRTIENNSLGDRRDFVKDCWVRDKEKPGGPQGLGGNEPFREGGRQSGVTEPLGRLGN